LLTTTTTLTARSAPPTCTASTTTGAQAFPSTIEFTVADDANLGVAVGRKHAKYGPWLMRNPCASVARIVPDTHDPHTWTFGPLVVIAVGV